MINKLMVGLVGVKTREKTAKLLFEKISKLSKDNSILLQAFNPDSIVSAKQLEHAFELANRSFKTKRNIARNLETELLLRAAGTEKIDKAIERAGVKDPSRILLFSDKKIPKKIIEELGEEDSSLLKLTNEKRKKITLLFGITEPELSLYSLEELVLERIALSEA
jgi:tRNA threonylcarbamoyladenosine modification (KEOPS) complex Cgi121 subunit